MVQSGAIRVLQLSDTHFSTPGNRSHGGFGYDTDAAFAAVFDHAFGASDAPGSDCDLVVVTGDVADHGRPDEYQVAVEALGRIDPPTVVVPGNHDFDVPLRVGVPRPGLGADRVLRVGRWLFLFADSNFQGRQVGDDGRLVDRDDRIEAEAALGPGEVAWIDEMIEASDADHVFVWLHHPPGTPGIYGSPTLDREATDLVERHPTIKGFAAGHIHSDPVLDVAGCPVHVCLALTINFDFDTWTTLPPGYRTYAFNPDGSIETSSFRLEDERWPMIELPDPATRFFKGELGFDDMLAEMADLFGG